MKIRSLLFALIFLSGSLLYAQQTVKGKVVDLESQFPSPGVNVKFLVDGILTMVWQQI